MADRFYVRDVPPTETIFSYIDARTGIRRLYEDMKPRARVDGVLRLDVGDVDLEALLRDVLAIISTHGFTGWRQKDGVSEIYGGFSLNYDPDSREGSAPHVSTIGSARNPLGTSAWTETERQKEPKHTYYDTYAFRRRTPASRGGYLGEFLDRCRSSLVRSRVGLICGDKVDPDDPSYRKDRGWHRDEPLVENTRVNIPIRTDPSFVMEILGRDPEHLSYGRAYSWDTNLMHRVFCRARTSLTRIHVVLGLSTWLDYDEATDSWSTNEYFGRIHPFDMLAEGLAVPGVRSAS